MFKTCEVTFYKLNIYGANFTNYHHMVESNFKGINLCKLCGKAILIKCILTFDNFNTNQSNTIKTVIRTFDLLNSSSYRNSLAVPYNNCFMYHNNHLQSPSQFELSRVNFSSFLLVSGHSHITSTQKYKSSFTPLAKLEVSWNFLLIRFSFCGITYDRQLRLNYH